MNSKNIIFGLAFLIFCLCIFYLVTADLSPSLSSAEEYDECQTEAIATQEESLLELSTQTQTFNRINRRIEHCEVNAIQVARESRNAMGDLVERDWSCMLQSSFNPPITADSNSLSAQSYEEDIEECFELHPNNQVSNIGIGSLR